MTNLRGSDAQSPSFLYDLGWVLQNRQISDEALCALLLHEYRGEIERLASSFLKSAVEINEIVDRTITLAVINRQRYSSNGSGKAWLYQIAISEYLNLTARENSGQAKYIQRVIDTFDPQAISVVHYDELIQSLGKKHGLFAFLRYGQGLANEDIAYILRITGEEVQDVFRTVKQRLEEHQQTCPLCGVPGSRLTDLEAGLRKAYQALPYPSELSEERLLDWQAAILKRAAGQQIQEQKRKRVVKTLQAGLLILALLGLGWFTTQTWPGQNQQPAPTKAASAQRAAVRPAIRQPTLAAPTPERKSIPTATKEYTPDLIAIRQLISNSQKQWHSIWADVQIIPSTATGTNQSKPITRKQAWISPPSFSRVIYGAMDGSPMLSYSVTGGQIYIQNFQNGITLREPAPDLILDADLQKLFFPLDISKSGESYRVTGSGTAANRPAWILDRKLAGRMAFRYWVDAQYGVILRIQQYDGKQDQKVIAEMVVNAIAFNADFPPRLFEPFVYKGNYFAHDVSGAPELPGPKDALINWSLPKIQAQPAGEPLPPGFNPASSSLVFQSQAGGRDGTAVELLADGYSLGTLPIGGSAILSCERSPDGKQIAYNAVTPRPQDNSALFIANLANITAGHAVLPGGSTSGDFAFAPDSRRLAFFGCDPVSGFCGVFLLDTLSGRTTKLIPLNFADYIFWRPDGKYLAMVGQEDTEAILNERAGQNMMQDEILALSQEWHFIVAEASTGNVVYKQVFNWSSLSAPANSPTNEWGNTFKASSSGLAGCINPPGRAR